MKSRPFSFPKSEKLVSHKLIDRLFSGGGSKSMSAYPLRLGCRILDADAEARQGTGFPGKNIEKQVLISVPKRCFKHAVDRNRVKRQVREAYRKHRNLYDIPEGKSLALAFIWLDRKHHSSEEVELKVINLLQRMHEKSLKNSAQ